MRTLKLFTLFLFVILYSSCSKKEYEDKPFESDWLLPMLKGEVTPISMTTLKNKSFNLEISPEDIGLSSYVPHSNPNESVYTDLAWYNLETNDIIKTISLDTCLIEMTFKNNFPVAIKEGTAISVFDVESSAIVYSFIFSQDVANGVEEVFYMDLSNIPIGNELIFTVETLILEAYEEAVYDESIEISFYIEKVSVGYLELFTNRGYALADTTSFDGSTIDFDETDLNITDSTIYGNLTFRTNNEFPINNTFQVLFLNENNQVVDSIFNDVPQIQGAEYNGVDFVAGNQSTFTAFISKERLARIKDAKKAVYILTANSNGYSGSHLHIAKDQMFSMKLIGDFKLILNPFDFFDEN